MGLFDLVPFVGDDPESATATRTTRSAHAPDHDPDVDVDLDDLAADALAGGSDARVTSEMQYDSETFDWPYDFKPQPGRDGRVMRDGHEYKVFRDPDEDTLVPDPETVFAGAWPRAMIENHIHNPDQPIFFGIDDYQQEVGLPKKETFRHILALGQTGGGKTTFFESYINQIAGSGHGFAAVDPGGEAAINLIRQMPGDPRDDDDVIFLDVGADYLTKRIGFNLLDTYHDPGDDGFQAELENRVADIVPLMEADEYARMRGIAEHILRGLIEADYTAAENGDGTDLGEKVNEYFEDRDVGPDHDAAENYTVQDMYHILSSKENREEWFTMIVDLGMARLSTYAYQLAQLDDDDGKLEPLIRRLRTWMESETVRPVVSQRTTTISIPEIVKSGKKLIIKCDQAPDTVREIVTGAVSRMIWSVCMARPSSENEYIQRRLAGEAAADIELSEEQDPFYLCLDEIHSLVGKNTKLVDMLAEARKKKLGLCLMTQQLNQIPSGSGGNNVREKIISNTGTTLAFHPGEDQKEQSAVATAFEGRGTDDIMVDSYHATVAITDEQGHTSEPLVVEMFPPVPPRRDLDAVVDVLQSTYDAYGVEKQSAIEDLRSVPDQFQSALEAIEGAVDGEDARLTEHRKGVILSVMFRLAIQQSADASEPVPMGDLVDAVEADPAIEAQNHPVDAMVTEAVHRNLLTATPGGDVSMTADGAAFLWDSGQSGSSGRHGHQIPMHYIGRFLSELGYTVTVPRQGGNDEIPDLRARPPIAQGGESYEASQAAKVELEQEHPEIVALTGTRDVAVEFEKATLGRPSQVGDNLRSATESDEFCLFVVGEGDSDVAGNARHLAKILAAPELTYVPSMTPNHVDARYYTHDGTRCRPRADGGPAGERVILPGGDVTYRWVRDGAYLCLRDNDGTEFARFGDLADWEDRSPEDFPAVCRTREDGSVTVRDMTGAEPELIECESEATLAEDYTEINAPFLPEQQFPDGFPDHGDDYEIAILPDDGERELQRYDPERETCVPLSEIGTDTTGADADGGNGANDAEGGDGAGAADPFSDSVLD